MAIEAYGFSETGSTAINGDVFFISEEEDMFVLADGASGAGKDGKVLMGQTCLNVVESFPFSKTTMEPSDYIESLIQNINNELIKVSQEQRNLIFGTIIAAVYRKGKLTIASLGDSPVFYCNGKTTVQIAKNPKQYEWMIQDGFITEDQYNGYIQGLHPMMRSCFNPFIPSIVPNFDIEQIEMMPNDIIILCCDGMSDWITKEEIIETINREGVKDGIHKLICQSKERALSEQSYFDDITAIAIRQK